MKDLTINKSPVGAIHELPLQKDLPQNWFFLSLGDICKTIKGKKPNNTGLKSEEQNIPYINIQAFETGQPSEFAEHGKYPTCNKDDVLIVWDGARAGLTGRGVSGYIGSTLAKIYSEPVENGYLFYFLKSQYKYLNTNTKGVGIPHIDPNVLFSIPFPLAPPDQQKLIVAEIEKQFSRLDEAVGALRRIQANLKRYKASVLKAAVEGKLTEQWRKENLPAPSLTPGKFYTYAILCEDNSIYIGHTEDIERRWKEHLEGKGSEWTTKHRPIKIAHFEEFDTRKEAADREKWFKTGFGRKWLKRELAAGRTRQAGDVEPASELLKRILAERRKKWEEDYIKKYVAAHGHAPKDDAWKKKCKAPASPDTSNLPELPKGWAWATVEQLAAKVQYGSSAKTNGKTDGVPVLRMGNIFEGRLKLDDLKYLPQHHAEFPDLLLKKGDLLFNRTNSPELVGKTAVYAGLPDSCSFASYLIRVQLNDGINPGFVSFYINSVYGRSWIKAVVSQQVGQANVNGTKLQALSVPLPPFAEQQKIVEEVESYLSVAEEIEAAIEANLKRAERLRQSILKKAFSGNLKILAL